jgi:hypothetical protein
MSGIFVIPDEELQSESWRLMLRQESEEDKFKRKQKEILEEVFKNY